MDDALMVANLVYFGTLVIGGVLLVFLAVATVITLVVAGTGQAVASVLMATVRALRGAVLEPPTLAAEAARAEYTRQAVVAKADAILAAQRTVLTAAAKAAAAAPTRTGAESEDGETTDEEVAIPVAASVKPAPVVTHMRPTPTVPARTGPRTGTQPILVVSRAS
ncbi:hypothetical protein GCM10027449_08410 [Sinomonas notoginsengisoli]|uniref:hypothetical protein n=1 Tax=Sinomonas notoginsengisoli TaxID=1457311 RepID=UPI001F35AFCF|nr:hypothetical protein [Sinomonas notoginsengisoli]